jgi:Fe-S-cluster-containing dehydrogenase component
MGQMLPKEDLLVRMQRDLRRALTKDPTKVKWAMVIDVAKCVGCHACTIGCVAENKLPPRGGLPAGLGRRGRHLPQRKKTLSPPPLHALYESSLR